MSCGQINLIIYQIKKSHYLSTGRNWSQLEKKVDAFICSIGTGGTLSGVSQFLKEKNKDIIIGLADPYGSAMYSYYTKGKLESNGSSITEGIGQGRITKNLEDILIDASFQITDKEALEIVYEMIVKEGLILGGSSGINIMGAIKLAKNWGKTKI